MTPLRAAWLGSWKAPWPFGRGRRWGDHAWALAAIAQAWLLGGCEGRWPDLSWNARLTEGPRPMLRNGLSFPTHPTPRPEWVALLRHGSPNVDPDTPGRKESDLIQACWRALRTGDGTPWMGLGTVLLDLDTRFRWLPLLAAVDDCGVLHLPPFLSGLIPDELRTLRPGWWECLFTQMDSHGLLVPDQNPPEGWIWKLESSKRRSLLYPLVLHEVPEELLDPAMHPWLDKRGGSTWVLDPHLRAWVRGEGASPAALAQLTSPSLERGDALSFEASTPARRSFPTPCVSHTCADPFRWLAAGESALRTHDYPVALDCFQWAHAHFERLRHAEGIGQAASKALQASVRNGDLPAALRWQACLGTTGLTPPLSIRAELELALGHRQEAMALLQEALICAPDHAHARTLLRREALLTYPDKPAPEDILSIPPRVAPPDAGCENDEVMDPCVHLAIKFRDFACGGCTPESFWSVWNTCPDQIMRLETGLRALEGFPAQRSLRRLLDLQVLVDRAGLPSSRIRLEAVWPAVQPPMDPSPDAILGTWLRNRPTPTWVRWESAKGSVSRGTGPPPPDEVFSALQRQDSVGPLKRGDEVWWGTSLRWERTRVGGVATIVDPNAVIHACVDLCEIAPWIACLAGSSPPSDPPDPGSILSDGSEPMTTLLRDLARVAPSALPVLILGPTGSGKELVAREIHARSKRKGPFIPINCAAFPENLMEAELFGSLKGAYTGADRDRKGAIEMAAGGTLFVDEVADLSPKLQSLLLRVLQEKEIRRVGGERIHKVDVRFLAATHRDLEHLAATGQFRRDLHYRLKGAVLEVPPLSERRHEFPYLIPRLMARVACEAGLECPPLAPGLPEALAGHPWPGNVRELQHALERAMLRREEGPLKPVHFPELGCTASTHGGTWEEATRTFQRDHLLKTLIRNRFQIAQAARELALTRPALYAAAKRLNLDLSAERLRLETIGA